MSGLSVRYIYNKLATTTKADTEMDKGIHKFILQQTKVICAMMSDLMH